MVGGSCKQFSECCLGAWALAGDLLTSFVSFCSAPAGEDPCGGDGHAFLRRTSGLSGQYAGVCYTGRHEVFASMDEEVGNNDLLSDIGSAGVGVNGRQSILIDF